MTITRAQAVTHMQYATGSTLAGATANDLVNDAGTWLSSANGWGYLARQTTLANLVQNQEYVALPADFLELIAAHMTSGYLAEVEQVPFEYIVFLRNSNIKPFATPGWCAPVWTTGALVAASLARLELHPAPSTNVTNGIRIQYRAGWTPLTDDAHIANIPEFMVPLFKETCALWALSHQERDVEAQADRIAALKAGPTWEAAVRTDGQKQATLGIMRGGAAQKHLNPSAVRFVNPHGPISIV
ncbi:MAG TPA: hypothetical protein VEJ18_20630 [Planctomycetota bacterium]|nr:hypothetical protein [Planctomycetota bacterium]